MTDTGAALPGTVAESMESVEAQGPTVEDAIAAALDQLQVGRDATAIEVLSEGARAVPGERLSATEARVRVTRLDRHTVRGVGLLEDLLDRMGLDARVSVRKGTARDATVDPPVILDVSGDDLGLLIGWRGETLRALQVVLNLMLDGEGEASSRRLIIDVERYRVRREDQVRDLALRIAHRVKRSGERYTLDPMQPYERRAIHMALEDDDGVITESSGKEPGRRIVIHPTGPAQPGLPERFRPAGGPPGRGRAESGGASRWRPGR